MNTGKVMGWDDLPEEVRLAAQLNPRGNVIDDRWHLIVRKRGPNGEDRGVYLPAVVLLAEIVGRCATGPAEAKAPGSREYRLEVSCDKIPLSYSQIVAALGISRKQARDAVALLRELGLIDVELRTEVAQVDGGRRKLPNRMYVGLRADVLLEMMRARELPDAKLPYYGQHDSGASDIAADD